eukprot:s877_g10.t1
MRRLTLLLAPARPFTSVDWIYVYAVNISIAEQTFSWFRGYASSFNTKAHDTHIFYVLLYVKMHNILARQNRLQHLNAFSARSKIAKAARILRKPASRKYHCRRPASSVNNIKTVHKKPANKDTGGPSRAIPKSVPTHHGRLAPDRPRGPPFRRGYDAPLPGRMAGADTTFPCAADCPERSAQWGFSVCCRRV